MVRRLTDAARRNPLRVGLGAGAVLAYALAFIPPYSTTDLGVVVLSAAPVLVASWLAGFWGGLAASMLTFPANALLLNLTGQEGWSLLTRPTALQGSILVLILGVVVGGLRDIAWQLQREHEAREATEAAARESDVRYRVVADTASDAIFTLDSERRILYANPAAERIFGWTVSELRGQPFDMLLDEDAAEEEVGQLERHLEKVPSARTRTALDVRAQRRDGTRMEVEASFGATEQEGALAYTGIMRNVTERRELERELLVARNEAVRANRAKSEFISRMSHELRTPLNAILGFSQLIDAQELAEEDRDSISQIRGAGRHLLAVVDEVLDIARIEAGRMALTLEPVRLDDAVAEAWDLVRPRAAERGIAFEAEGSGPEVEADTQRLRQVLLNLLSNAIKYNDEGGAVRVTWRQQPTGAVRLEVRDQGAGVPEEARHRLFTPFDRLGAERSGVEGTGVGLSLSKSLTEAMGGRIGYERAENGGSMFWIELPVSSGREGAEVREASVSMEPHSLAPQAPDARDLALCVLVDPVQQRLIERLLESHGLRSVVAMQAGLGLELAAQHRPSAVVMGGDLPDLDPVELVRRLRAGAAALPVPIVVLAEEADPAVATALLDAGATTVLDLPLDVPQFLGALPDNTSSERVTGG